MTKANENTQQEPGTGNSGSGFVSIATDIVTVLLTATLLSLPLENGFYWPVGFIALVPLLVRIWTRPYWAIFTLTFFSFALYLYFSLQWVGVYSELYRIMLALMNGSTYACVFMLAFFIKRKYNHHFFATVLTSLIVILDFKQTLGYLAFPWPILCHSQYANLPLIQIASVTGCWGVTFLIINFNEALSHLIAFKFRVKILPVAVLPLVLIGVFGLYGAFALAKSLPEPEINATVVQWVEPTNVQWNQSFNQRAIDGYSQITMEELTPDPIHERLVNKSQLKRLVVWPETSIPDAIRNQYTMNRIRSLANTYDATFLVGCITYDPAEGAPIDPENPFEPREEYGNYNSIVAFESDNSVIPIYSKVHLVPFGEVIPMKEIIIGWFPEYTWGGLDISPGTGFHVTETQAGKIGTVICFESFFPQYPRRLVRNGAEILVLVSNTSWFGRTNASYHHARFDTFRAVENGIWFCRAATTGISSVIDPQGRTVDSTRMFEGDALTVPISGRQGMTFYTRHGDWVPALCGMWVMILMLGLFVVKENRDYN